MALADRMPVVSDALTRHSFLPGSRKDLSLVPSCADVQLESPVHLIAYSIDGPPPEAMLIFSCVATQRETEVNSFIDKP